MIVKNGEPGLVIVRMTLIVFIRTRSPVRQIVRQNTGTANAARIKTLRTDVTAISETMCMDATSMMAAEVAVVAEVAAAAAAAVEAMFGMATMMVRRVIREIRITAMLVVGLPSTKTAVKPFAC